MKLPIIKHLVKADYMPDSYEEAVDVLISYCEARGVKDEELDVIGEIISNLEGAIVVKNDIQDNNTPEREALNAFMKRVINAVK